SAAASCHAAPLAGKAGLRDEIMASGSVSDSVSEDIQVISMEFLAIHDIFSPGNRFLLIGVKRWS
ncbi:MAG TPA: hypothetical protein VLQ89_06365, partial [Candidatus Binatia bacterium]|nr:hypothetical protein [Candidatus Binatia bacterium]